MSAPAVFVENKRCSGIPFTWSDPDSACVFRAMRIKKEDLNEGDVIGFQIGDKTYTGRIAGFTKLRHNPQIYLWRGSPELEWAWRGKAKGIRVKSNTVFHLLQFWKRDVADE